MQAEIRKGIAFLKKNDPVLRRVIDEVGPCTLTPKQDYFASLVQSIMYQQVSLYAAAAIHQRLLRRIKTLSPRNVLSFSDQEFKECGVSRQKRTYLRDLAHTFLTRRINLDKMHHLADEELIALLSSIKGVGRWTAKMFLMFTLARLDVFPLDDLGLQRAIRIQYGYKKTPSQRTLLRIAKRWTPYKTLASWYLWNSLEGDFNGWD